MAVFYILDISIVNACILYCGMTTLKIIRRNLILFLAAEVCQSEVQRAPEELATEPQNLKRHQCELHSVGGKNVRQNKSTTVCRECEKSCCGTHTTSKVVLVECSTCVDELCLHIVQSSVLIICCTVIVLLLRIYAVLC